MLSLKDVIKMIPPTHRRLDPEIREMDQRKKIFERRINQVYKNISIFNKIWPHGQPIDFFIALMFCNDSKQLTFHKLFNSHFLLQVIWQAETFGYHHFSSIEEREEYVQTNPYFIQDISGEEFELSEIKNFTSETSDFSLSDSKKDYLYIDSEKKLPLGKKHSFSQSIDNYKSFKDEKTDYNSKISNSIIDLDSPNLITNDQQNDITSITILKNDIFYTAGISSD